jgi:hypothetical protein
MSGTDFLKQEARAPFLAWHAFPGAVEQSQLVAAFSMVQVARPLEKLCRASGMPGDALTALMELSERDAGARVPVPAGVFV